MPTSFSHLVLASGVVAVAVLGCSDARQSTVSPDPAAADEAAGRAIVSAVEQLGTHATLPTGVDVRALNELLATLPDELRPLVRGAYMGAPNRMYEIASISGNSKSPSLIKTITAARDSAPRMNRLTAANDVWSAPVSVGLVPKDRLGSWGMAIQRVVGGSDVILLRESDASAARLNVGFHALAALRKRAGIVATTNEIVLLRAPSATLAAPANEPARWMKYVDDVLTHVRATPRVPYGSMGAARMMQLRSIGQ